MSKLFTYQKRHVQKVIKQFFSLVLVKQLLIILILLSFCINTMPRVVADGNPSIKLLSDFDNAIIRGNADIIWEAWDLMGHNLDIFVFYKNNNDILWKRAHDDSLKNTGVFQWDCSNFSDGHYQLKIEAINPNNNIAHDSSGVFTIDNDNSPLKIQNIVCMDTTIDSDSFVRDGDDVHIVVSILNGGHLQIEDITADLQCFSKEIKTYPDSFDGSFAEWDLHYVSCVCPDDELTIFVDVDRLEQITYSIVADNTKPSLDLNHPKNGLYLLHKRFMPLKTMIIIGNVPIDIKASDDSGIQKIEIYLDGSCISELTNKPYFTTIKQRLMGKHVIKIKVYDEAENCHYIQIQPYIFSFFNF